MKKVFEIFNNKKVAGDVGIEIEAEGKKVCAVETEVWKSVNDPSLDGVFGDTCCEYVLRNPIPIDTVLPALLELKDFLKDAKLDFSHRTSVHVHINVQQLTSVQLMNMMFLYYLFEKSLVAFSGKSREGNNFCLRLIDAEGVLEAVTKMFRDPDNMKKAIKADNYRYAAMNIESLTKYGSLEFRSMEGNLNPEWIEGWVQLLYSLREAAKKFDNVLEISDIAHGDAAKLATKVFGDKIERLNKEQYEFDIQEALSLTMDLIAAYDLACRPPVEKKKAAKKFEYEIGDAVNYDQAVAWQRKGGKLDHNKNKAEVERGLAYVILELPDQVEKEVEVEPELVFKNNVKPAW